MKRPLILLGCGYIGTALAREALREGRGVHALVRSEAKAQALREIGLTGVVAGDVAEDGWHDAFPLREADAVYCVSSGGGDDTAYRRAYAEGMASALRWARGRHIGTFVYTSSTGVYPQTGGVTVDETSAVGGDTRSDILALTERLLLERAGEAGSGIGRAFALRLGGLYGPWRHYMLDTLLRGETRFAGGGDFRVNYLHRDDAVSALLAALGPPDAARNGVYNVTDGHPETKSAIARWLAARLGLPEPAFDAGTLTARAARRGAASPDRIVSNRAFRTEFGWTPAYPDFRSGYEAILSRGGLA